MKTKKNPFLQFSAATLAAVTLASFSTQSAQATSGSWTAVVDGNWGVDANWNGVPAGFPNGEGQAANFSVNTPDLLITTTLDGNYTVSSSGINAVNSADWLVTHPTNTLTFDHTGTNNSQVFNSFNGSSSYTLDTNILLNSNLVLSGNGNNGAKVILGATVGARTITGTGNITINNTNSNGGSLMTINSNINTTGGISNISTFGQNNHLIAGVIGSGVTGVTQNSIRTMILSGNNTYTTPTTVSLGTLQAGAASVANVSGAFGNNSAVTIADAAATLSLNNFNTQIGSLAGGGAVGGTVSLGSAVLPILPAILTTGGLNTDTAFAGIISGTGGLTKIGSGTQTLGGANTFTGPITLSGGGLNVTTNGVARTFSSTLQPFNVTAASTLGWSNTSATTVLLSFSGTAAFTLGAKLTVQNTSTVTANNNGINLARPIDGAGNLEIETYNVIDDSADSFIAGRVQLSASSPSWTGDLVITKGTVALSGSTATTTGSGAGDIVIGAVGNPLGAGLTFNTDTNITYANDIVVNTGGFRAIRGNNFNTSNMTFSGAVTLNGSLTLDHSRNAADRRISLSGPISGNGGLTITRAEGNIGSTTVLSSVSNYSGPTIVKPTASLAISSTGSLASNITVESTGRLGGGGGTTGNLTLNDGANFFFFASGTTPATFNAMDVSGSVTLSNNFSMANIVGGSQGEPVNWNATQDGTYTLIGTTLSSVSNIQNFGSVNYATIPISPTSTTLRYAYFQGTTGLQIVVSSTPPVAADPFTTWSFGAAFNVDTNNDGISNGLAFLLGAANVNDNANSLLPAPTQSGGALTMTFVMRNATARGTASLQVQHSSDLGITDLWSTLVTVPDVDGTDSGIVFDITAGTPLNSVIATIPASGNAAGGKLFGRVKSNP